MSDRPPSPPTPGSPPAMTIDADTDRDDRIVATTPQLVDEIETTLDCRLDEQRVEELLVELDRQNVVEWVTVTRSGTIVWDLTAAPDRIADAIATAIVDRITTWLDGGDRCGDE